MHWFRVTRRRGRVSASSTITATKPICRRNRSRTPWAEAQIRSAYRCGHAGYTIGAGEGADTVRQDAAGQAALGHRRGAIPQECARASGVVRDASGRQHLVATETELSAQAVVEIYAERWGIEPLFHNLKRWWGVTNLWQQSKAALELWMQIRSTAYALTQVLALKLWESFPLMEIAPWRKGAMITAGLFGQWMRIQFIGLRVRDACNPKSGNFVMPFPGQDQRLQC
ncbi:transposase [Candidatus Nitrotoga sp. BS]|uniref:transposase n=1 Tax=Candidatus Nitrotoga sp. BS TaxID=2890408 RepID=UPI0030B92A75